MWTKIGQYECRHNVMQANITPRKLRRFQKAMAGLTLIWRRIFGGGFIVINDRDQIGSVMEVGRTYRYTIERLDPDLVIEKWTAEKAKVQGTSKEAKK